MSKIILDVTDCNVRELSIVHDALKSLNKAVASMKVFSDTFVSVSKDNAAEAAKMNDIDTNAICEHFF